MKSKNELNPNKTEDPFFHIDPKSLFRLPWTRADNAMTWLEPTRKCNISCEACFAINDPNSEKPLSRIKKELETMLYLRRCDAVLIAGGEPLTHPNIVEITSMIKAHNVKPVIITNGVNLDSKLVKELKKAGAHGFTFHVDSHQSRPGWEGKSEKELNELRQYFADMLYHEGKLICSFNTTVFPDALPYIPDLIEWSQQNVDKVNIFSLIAVRLMETNGSLEYYVQNRKIDLSWMAYSSAKPIEKLSTHQIYQQVKKAMPEFELCAYLGGTVLPDSLKWTIGCWVGNKKRVFGSMGYKSMEILQNFHHLIKGTYLAYTKPALNRKGRLMFLLGLFDPSLRKIAKKYLLFTLRKPQLLFTRIYSQTINIMQPIDILPNGEADTCDGCPNITLWKDRLVSSCRLDDYIKYGSPIYFIPKIK